MGALGHIEDPQAALEGCRFCWMCRHVCPVGHVTHRETLTPHAWALTIDSVKRGTLQWNADTVDVLYSCADCGLCRTHCVTDQPLPDAIASARAAVAAAGTAPAAVYALHEKLRKWGNPYQERVPLDKPAPGSGLQAPGTASQGPTPPVERSLTPGARSPELGASADVDVALFVGDAAAYLAPGALEAALALVQAAGLRPVPVGVGLSNGLLASTLGFPETAVSLARAVMAEVEATGLARLLVLGPGDRYAFERVYQERLGIDWLPGVVVQEVTTVLAEALANGTVKFRLRADAPAYAYHDPAHAPRIGRDGLAPRALLAAALGGDQAVTLFWRENRAHPSGAVGGLSLTQPAIAARLSDARLGDAAKAGAKWVITEDPGCLHDLRSRPAAPVEVRGLYELLRDQLEG